MAAALHAETVMNLAQNQDHQLLATQRQKITVISQNLSLATAVETSTTPVRANRLHQHHRGVVPETAAVVPVAGKAVN